MITRFLQEAPKFEIQRYKIRKDPSSLRNEGVPFSGSPLKHPFDAQKIVLIADPYANHTHYFEFKTDDILFVEELPNLVNLDGDSVQMARVWVKKHRVGLRCTPFIVDDLNHPPEVNA